MKSLFRFLLLASLGLPLPLLSACDSSTGECDGCTIEGQCVKSGDINPDSPCEGCNPAGSRTEWTARPDGASCDDGITCSVEDTCQAGVCEGRSDCEGGQYCDRETRECVDNCPHCSIDGWCYYAFQKDPANPCRHCDVTADRFAWSDNDGEACDDGVFCNGTDTCAAGVCTVHADAPCGDDGVVCNGEETCDEANAECLHSNDVCEPDEVCNEATDRCCRPMQSITCDAESNLVWVDACGNLGELYRDCPFGCQGALCVCDPGFTGVMCDRCVVHVNGATGNDGNDGTSWAVAKLTLQAGINEGNARGCEVWVAAGTYTPEGGREGTFAVYAYNQLYGGFAGTELSPRLRDIAANPTVIEGEIGDPALISDNVCTLVVVQGTGAVIDGFTIQHGNRAADCAYGSGRSAGGVGYSLSGGWDETLTIRNTTLRGNNSTGASWMWDAAALFTEGASVHVDGCVFEDNTGVGAVVIPGGAFQLRNSIFRNNASVRKAALFAWGGGQMEARIDNCQFLENTSSDVALGASAAGLHYESNDETQLVVNNSVFAGNTGTCVGAISTRGALVVASSTIAGNRATAADLEVSGTARCTGGVLGSGYRPMILRHSILWGNTIATPGFGRTRQQFLNRNESGYHEFQFPLMSSSVIEYSERACVPVSQMGDGVMDCPLGDDEVAMGGDTQNCTAGNYQCQPAGAAQSVCIPAAQVCDGITQCASGRDEAACEDCGPGYFKCKLPGDQWTANRFTDPRLVNWDTALGPLDLHLTPASICIDAGVTANLLPDHLDLDNDGDFAEPMPVDLDGNPRVSGLRVDIGAYERP